MGWPGLRSLFAAVCAALSCSSPTAPPLGQAMLIVDTDMTVPKLVGRLRVDVYAADGTWFATRDVLASAPAAWPVSFALYLPEHLPSREAMVRLRAYPEGKVRDYRGERFEVAPDDPHSIAVRVTRPTDGPWLSGGTTPSSEPLPFLAVDRLVRVRIDPGKIGSVRIVLRGACAGTMVDLASRTTCVDREGERVPVQVQELDPSLDVRSSVQGSFETAFNSDCATAPRKAGKGADGTPLDDEEVCVPGGVFVLGSADGQVGETSDDVPERFAAIPSFLMDVHEVTVARLRDAFARGFVGGVPLPNNQPLAGPVTNGAPTSLTDGRLCTWTTSNGSRERFAVNCIWSDDAREVCRWFGGDLPSEAQWEYAATAAQRTFKSHYPWGDVPDVRACEDVVHARGNISGDNSRCGWGPLPATEGTADVFPGVGVHGLAGGQAEVTRDPFVSLAADCWRASSLVLPHCDADTGERAVRGAAWSDGPIDLLASGRDGVGAKKSSASIGFRCVRPGNP